MAKKSGQRKPRGKKADKHQNGAVPADAATEQQAAGVGDNKLSDDDLRVLTIQWKDKYESALAAKKRADADFKNVAKGAKAELGKNAVATIKAMIELDTEEGEAAVKEQIEIRLTAARWMNSKIGQQFDLFAKPSSTNGEPYDGWVRGWHKGQEALAQNFHSKRDGEEANA
jgi:hypothetical protein